MNDSKAWSSRNYNYWNQQQPNVTSNNPPQMSYVTAASQQSGNQSILGSTYELGSVNQESQLLQHQQQQQQQQQLFHRMNTNAQNYVPNNMGVTSSNTNNGNGGYVGGSLNRHHSTSSLSSVEGMRDSNLSSVNSVGSSTNPVNYGNRLSFGSTSGIIGSKFMHHSSSESSIGPYSFENNIFSPTQVSTGYFSNYEYAPRADTAVSNLTLIPPDSTATTNTTNTGYGKMANEGSGHRQSQEKSPHNVPLKEIEKLKMELALKNQMINNLSEKLNQVKKTSNSVTLLDFNGPNAPQEFSHLGRPVTIPAEYTSLFKELTQQLRDCKKELEDTKQRLELLVVGVTMSPQNASITCTGQYDEQEVAHRIVSKLQILTDENESLIKMMNFGSKSSLLVELGLLRHENKMLKEKIAANASK
ncbi:uncharacterized protein KQ657_003426 [Scheffersomyces spartinae]|uniref:Protein MUM2 n=1 Tax=Scheffersomyces spartinae TaxID=45513 RepID=A0A9P7VE77_9ASCO|nr:uncharacterized protein KQ657_003426 [Scheffersomyces spartinae]KAG7195656.1 hypothetical protein KQ657_003426 [Scheffersomyces spartinae]